MAARWFEKSTSGNLVAAGDEPGLPLASGTGVKRNVRQAVKHFQGAANNGDANAQYGLARRLSPGDGVRKNEAQARRHRELAAPQEARRGQAGAGRPQGVEAALRRALRARAGRDSPPRPL